MPRRVESFLDLAAADAAAALVLAASKNRYAAYHCQQAVEKLVKAVLLHRGKEAGVEHHLDVLIAKLADTDTWKSKLKPFETYSPFATAWRYPAPGGRLPKVPDPADVASDATKIEALIVEARGELLKP
ncbi:MAG: HEPN domain-containing protein [Planctomycetia bacterium]|nr:HEPN domain-containing protein [Planctomycetia bacterium]